MPGARRAVRTVTALFLAAGVVSCGNNDTSAPTSVSGSSTTVTPVDSVPLRSGDISWMPCGAIFCGAIDVPASHLNPAGPVLRVALYRRVASAGATGGTLVLVPDFDGPTARQLAEQTSVMVGPAARNFDVVAISPRGFYDSSALPCGTETEWTVDPARASEIAEKCMLDHGDVAPSYGVLDAADDVQAVVESLGAVQVKAVGWGRGATILAAWKMSHPTSSSAVVLDSPDDPGIARSRLAAMNRAAGEDATLATLMWCTSHISCPFVEYSSKRVEMVLTDIRDGLSGATTESHFRLAFLRAIREADFGGLFRALSSAEDGDFAPLAAFAGTKGSAAEASFAARIAATCGDLSAAARGKVVTDDAAFKAAYFRTGLGATPELVCSTMPAPTRPLDALKPAAAARGASVRVYVARADGITSPTMVKAFATRLDWSFRQVGVEGHFVVGRDRATTNAVSKYLAGE